MNKKSNIPKTHLFTPEDLHLFELTQIFGACDIWFHSGMRNNIATYDLIVRDMPKNRNFMILSGLEEVIKGILEWGYTKEEINYLVKNKAISKELGAYLENFKFRGTVYAMPEGTIFFPKEPIIRITAPLIEANLLTLFLFQAICSNTIYTSKIIRNVIAAGPTKKILGAGIVRAHGFEAAMKNRRAAYICGTYGTGSIPGFNRKFNTVMTSPLRNAFHAVIKSFPSELEAMRKSAEISDGKVSLMVDTYDFKQGIKNAIIVAKELKAKRKNLHGITIDSGNLLKRTKLARRMFDKASLKDIKITVASNLDENKIFELNKKNIPCNAFLVGTEISTVSDDPKLEIVYKISQIRKGQGNIRQLAKFSEDKESYPGEKQVFRIYKKEKFLEDIIGLSGEKLGKKLLIEIIKNGKLIYKLPTLDEIKDYVNLQLKQLPERLLDINKQHNYKVKISKKLKDLFEEVKKEHLT